MTQQITHIALLAFPATGEGFIQAVGSSAETAIAAAARATGGGAADFAAKPITRRLSSYIARYGTPDRWRDVEGIADCEVGYALFLERCEIWTSTAGERDAFVGLLREGFGASDACEAASEAVASSETSPDMPVTVANYPVGFEFEELFEEKGSAGLFTIRDEIDRELIIIETVPLPAV